MWTLNSEKTLETTLKSIEKAIPKKYINNKIIIDGFSKDSTLKIAEKHNWNIVLSEKGIGKQANIGLSLVETEIFASFEHDIILNPNWFNLIVDTIKEKNVAVSQGIRLSVNKTLKIIEEYSLKRNLRYSSIDNNLYKTKIIRDVGGFSEKHIASVDRELQDRIIDSGYKWVISKNIISKHNITNLIDYSNHVYNYLKKDSYKETFTGYDCVFIFLFSPLRAFHMILKEKHPFVFVGYPFYRFNVMRGILEHG